SETSKSSRYSNVASEQTGALPSASASSSHNADVHHTVRPGPRSPTYHPFLAKFLSDDVDGSRPNPPLPLPKDWTEQHDLFICVQDIKDVRHDLIPQNLKQAFPELTRFAIDADMIEKRLWCLDLDTNNTIFSEAMATVDKENADRKRAARIIGSMSSDQLSGASADVDAPKGNVDTTPQAGSASPVGTVADAFASSSKKHKFNIIPQNENTKPDTLGEGDNKKPNTHGDGDNKKSVGGGGSKVKAVPLEVAAQQAREEIQHVGEQPMIKGHEDVEGGGIGKKKQSKGWGLSKRNDAMG
ncbi:hypothetical protein LTS18_004081, partial [Coniosporium uncinatum]